MQKLNYDPTGHSTAEEIIEFRNLRELKKWAKLHPNYRCEPLNFEDLHLRKFPVVVKSYSYDVDDNCCYRHIFFEWDSDSDKYNYKGQVQE
jgi:hypothetical protein